MLGRVVFLAVILAAVAVAAPHIMPGLLTIALHSGDRAAPAQPVPVAHAVEPDPPAADSADSQDYNGGRRVALRANAEGHFVGEATINGSRVAVMVDTGATTVALTDETAHRLGIYPALSAYGERIATANGTVMAARVTLREVRIGSVSLRDVVAVVVPGSALPVDLLGMSFLSRLSRFEVSGGQLVLSQ